MIDWDKPVQTRNGYEAVVYTTNGKNKKYPVICEYKHKNGYWALIGLTLDGKADADIEGISDYDIINVPKLKVGGWLNVYSSGLTSSLYPTKEMADANARCRPGRISSVFIEFEEGEGLE